MQKFQAEWQARNFQNSKGEFHALPLYCKLPTVETWYSLFLHFNAMQCSALPTRRIEEKENFNPHKQNKDKKIKKSIRVWLGKKIQDRLQKPFGISDSVGFAVLSVTEIHLPQPLKNPEFLQRDSEWVRELVQWILQRESKRGGRWFFEPWDWRT